MKKKIFFLLIISTTVSCKRIFMYSFGVRSPKEESGLSLNTFVKSFNLDTNDIYIPKDTSSFFKLNTISSSQSGYVFFNSNEEMLMYKDTGKACSGPVILFSKNLCNSEHTLFYKRYNANIIVKEIKPLSISKATTESYDYYAVIFWYKFFGRKKFEEDVVNIVHNLKRSNCKIKIYLVNLDLQKGWKKDIPIRIM